MRCSKAYNGSEMLRLAAAQEVHLILLDVMMPGMDGLSAMAELRKTSNVPVILLTAKSEDTDKVLGLNLGADDYVTKPFNPIEVMARVRSQLRRYLQLGGGQVLPTQVTIGGIMLDDAGRTVTVDGEPVALTPTEFDILRLLMQHAGTVFTSPREIYRRVWGDSPVGVENAVAVHIRHLRSKIEIDPTEPRYLKVVWARDTKWRNDEMKKLQDNLAARIAASVILTVSFLLTLLAPAGIVLLASYQAYNDGGAHLRTSYLHAAGVREYYDHVEPVLEGLVHQPQSYQNYLNSLNVHVDVKTTDGTTVFSNAKEGETSLLEDPFSYTFTTGETKLWKNTFSDAEKAQRALERFPRAVGSRT